MAKTNTSTRKAPAQTSTRPTGVAPRKPVPVAPASASTAAQAPEGTYREHPALSTLPALVEEYRQLQLQLAALDTLDTRRKALGQDIEALLLAADQKTVTVGDLQITRVEVAGRKTLSADRLLALGVPADVIVQATSHGKPSSHVRVTVADAELSEARDQGAEQGAGWASRRRA